MVSSLYSAVLKELGNAGISPELVFENPVEEYKKLIGCETIGKAIRVLGENLRRICEYAGSQKSGAYSRPVVKALGYMEECYSSPALSLEAAAAGLSSARFSTSFKSETGVSFTDYLLKLRMEKAKELMRDPNRKIYEIAMMTGYSNIPYFSTAFKKYTGCPPSEYREKQQGSSGQTRDSVLD
jgi:two-component system response regulator YesN